MAIKVDSITITWDVDTYPNGWHMKATWGELTIELSLNQQSLADAIPEALEVLEQLGPEDLKPQDFTVLPDDGQPGPGLLAFWAKGGILEQEACL